MASILIIDDDPHLLEALYEIFLMNDHRVLKATGGEIGLELAKTHRPDLVICDHRMAGMSGYEVLRELRDSPETASTLFMFLSATINSLSSMNALMLADGYALKPFQVDDLLSKVDKLLSRQS